jgi:hypothetical protein
MSGYIIGAIITAASGALGYGADTLRERGARKESRDVALML